MSRQLGLRTLITFREKTRNFQLNISLTFGKVKTHDENKSSKRERVQPFTNSAARIPLGENDPSDAHVAATFAKKGTEGGRT